jgi:hypothetical protein
VAVWQSVRNSDFPADSSLSTSCSTPYKLAAQQEQQGHLPEERSSGLSAWNLKKLQGASQYQAVAVYY